MWFDKVNFITVLNRLGKMKLRNIQEVHQRTSFFLHLKQILFGQE